MKALTKNKDRNRVIQSFQCFRIRESLVKVRQEIIGQLMVLANSLLETFEP